MKDDFDDDARDCSIDSNFDSVSSQSENEGDGKDRSQAMVKPPKESRRKRRSKRRKGARDAVAVSDLSADKDGCLQKHNRFVIKNGCCRECMKAFSK